MRLSHGEPAHRVAVQTERGDLACMADPQPVDDAALIDAEKQLIRVDRIRKRVETPHLRLTADEPPGRPLDGTVDVGGVRQRVRAFVKSHRDVRAEVGLDLHALLRTHENQPAVHMGMKRHALFSDLTELRKRKDLKAA